MPGDESVHPLDQMFKYHESNRLNNVGRGILFREIQNTIDSEIGVERGICYGMTLDWNRRTLDPLLLERSKFDSILFGEYRFAQRNVFSEFVGRLWAHLYFPLQMSVIGIHEFTYRP